MQGQGGPARLLSPSQGQLRLSSRSNAGVGAAAAPLLQQGDSMQTDTETEVLGPAVLSLPPLGRPLAPCMAFNDLQQLGAFGRFQQIQVTLVILPLFLMSSHITLQNLTAAISAHRGLLPADASLGKDGELEAWLPRDRQERPESDLRFTSPRWGPPLPNGTEANGTGATEPCASSWIYNNTLPSAIAPEVRLPGLLRHPFRLLHPPLTIPPTQRGSPRAPRLSERGKASEL